MGRLPPAVLYPMKLRLKMSVLSDPSPLPPPTLFGKLSGLVAGRAREWPTALVLIGCYGGFAALTLNWPSVPVWLAVPLAGYLICLHGHLVHEIVHGHPTNNARLNQALVGLNLGGWVPFAIYRDMHLDHHRSEHLSHPVLDPESHYTLPEDWSRLGPVSRAIFTAMNTAIGRMVLGGPWAVISFWRSEAARMLGGDLRYATSWLCLAANNCLLVVWWLWLCEVPIWAMLAAGYCGVMLMVLRSFLEHRPGPSNEERCAIVEGEWFMGLLFLNNCYHLVHHDKPGLSWYDIPRVYERDRDQWRARTGGYWFQGYREVFRRYALTPKDTPVHPDA